MALKQYVKDARDIASAMEIYIGKLNMTGFSGSYPYLEDIIMKNIKYVKSSAKASKLTTSLTDPIDKKHILDNAFAFYAEIMGIKRRLWEVMDLFNEHQVNPVQEGSQTSSGSTITQALILDLFENLSDLQEIMSHYMPMSQVDELTESFTSLVLTHVQNTEEKDVKSVTPDYYTAATAQVITDEYEKYSSSGTGDDVVFLYQTIMKDIIEYDTGHREGAKVVRIVMKLIEKLKTASVMCPRLELIGNANKKNNTVQRLIQWNNLIPGETSKPFNEMVFDLIGVKITGENSLDKACKVASTNEKKIGFIVMRKVSKNPMEHRIMSLIDKNYIMKSGNFQSADAGINKKLYDRTRTINPLKADMGDKNVDSVSVYEKEHSDSDLDFFYILETIDGTNYRVLHPWDLNAREFGIPAAWVKNIPVFARTPSKRMEGYNETLNDVILEHLSEPLMDMDFMSRDEIRKADIKWKNIRENIRREIKEEFRKKLTSKAALSSLLASTQLQSRILLEVARQLESDEYASSNNTARDDIYYEEMSLSYLKDLQDMQRRIGRELVNIYQKEFASSSPASNVMKIFDEVLEAALSKFINNKSNIFLTIKFKSELLNKTLLQS
jgi:hypothetical protein